MSLGLDEVPPPLGPVTAPRNVPRPAAFCCSLSPAIVQITLSLNCSVMCSVGAAPTQPSPALPELPGQQERVDTECLECLDQERLLTQAGKGMLREGFPEKVRR